MMSMADFDKMRFRTIALDDRWTAHLGAIEPSGTIMVWGDSGQGKTSYCLQLAKALTKAQLRTVYISMEEGYVGTLQTACRREGLVGNKYFYVSAIRTLDEIEPLLVSQRAPRVVIIDSLQYSGMDYDDYKELTTKYPKQLFIIVSHADGREPRGAAAQSIKYNANVKVVVVGFQAFATSRYGGGAPYIISEAKVKGQKL